MNYLDVAASGQVKIPLRLVKTRPEWLKANEEEKRRNGAEATAEDGLWREEGRKREGGRGKDSRRGARRARGQEKGGGGRARGAGRQRGGEVRGRGREGGNSSQEGGEGHVAIVKEGRDSV